MASACGTGDVDVAEVIAPAFLVAVWATQDHFVILDLRNFNGIFPHKKRGSQIEVAGPLEMNLKTRHLRIDFR